MNISCFSTKVLGIAVLLSATTSQLCAQATLPDRIDDYVRASYGKGDFHGAILVANDGEVIYENGLGYANYEWQIANTPATRFRIGSITKQFTALLVFQMVETGELSLSDTISDHLDYYRKDTGSKVTLEQLLNHRSGIPDLSDEFTKNYERNFYPTQEFVESFASGDLESAPGERFQYSNAGYDILGAILEEVAGKSYGELLQEKVFEPLGMDATLYVGDMRIITEKADGYRRKVSADEELMHAALLDPSVAFAAGGIYSTTGDLYKWDRALYSDLLLTKTSRQQLFTSPYGDTYSNGWIQYPVNVPDGETPFTVTMHQGSINGYSGVIYRNLQTQDLVVILNNMSTNGSEWKMGEELMTMLQP